MKGERKMVLDFERAGDMLDAIAEKLPKGIFDGLNGGVAWLPDTVTDPEFDYEVYIMGEFCCDQMGRYINLYYGSFAAMAEEEGWTQEDWERELRETLHHELTHHIEGLAGDRSLDRQDEQWQREERARRREERR